MEIFAPVARLGLVRLILALATQHGWEVIIKSVFLNGNLQEEVYITYPEGFITKIEKHKVSKLSKALTVYYKHQGHGTYVWTRA